MIETLLKIRNWQNLLGKSISSIFRIALMSKPVKTFKNTEPVSKDLIILGNGPGLKPFIEENRDNLSKYELLCVNHFSITDYYTELKPKYYVAIAFDLFLDDIMPHFVEASNKLFNAIADKTDWPLKFFITVEAKKHQRWQKILSRNKNVEIIYINLTPIEGFQKFMYRNFDKAKGMPRPHNVMVPAIYTAIYLKAKKVFLAGADHSWLKELYVDENNQTLFFDKHFYDNEKQLKRFNYDTENYLKLHEIINSISCAFASYHILRGYAEYRNTEVLNATPKSFIDAFKRSKI